MTPNPESPDIELQLLDPPQPEFRGIDIDDDNDSDIYRGDNPFLKDDASSVTTTSGSSSSSSERGGGAFGVISAVVELAISRWARGVRRGSSASSISTSSSSTSSSSSSSNSSVSTLARARRRLRRRKSASQSSLQTIISERDIVARITRLKALEESRQLARHFALYLPPSIALPGRDLGSVPEGNTDDPHKREVSTTSLSLVLSHLENIAKRTTKSRRLRGRSRGPHAPLDRSTGMQSHRRGYQPHSDCLVGEFRPSSSFDPSTAKKSKKGKNREPSAPPSSKNTLASTPALSKRQRLMPKAWFLDVASPTWADLKSLGKVSGMISFFSLACLTWFSFSICTP